jgi:hypothetical protein
VRGAPALPETTRADGVKGRGARTVDLQLVVLDHAVRVALLHLYERVLDALHVVDGQREEDDLGRVGGPAALLEHDPPLALHLRVADDGPARSIAVSVSVHSRGA